MNDVFSEHNHQLCINSALKLAQQRCLESGGRLTQLRENVLKLILQSHKPLGAYDILENLQANSAKRIAPPTVYRALDFWLEQGLVHRITSLNAFIACNADHESHQKSGFLICTACRKAEEINDLSLFENAEKQALSSGFTIKNCTIEISGLCRNCSEKAEN